MKRQHSPAPADIDLVASDWVVRRQFGLTAEEQVEFDRWAAVDPRHAEALSRHVDTWKLLDRPRHSGKGDLMVRELRMRASRRRRMGAALATAAAACLLVALWPGGRSGAPLPVAPGATSAVVLLPDKQILPDGSIVELNGAAAITVDFSPVARRVILRQGEAHFEVMKDPERPFVVRAAGVEVRAVGTAFAVDLGESAVEVLVTEGRVAVDRRDLERVARVRRPNLPTPAESSLPDELGAGQRAVINRADAVARIESVPSGQLAQLLAWRAPRLDFSDTPLAEAVALMSRHSTVRVEIADPELARMRVNGLFRADNTDTFIRLLEVSFDVTAERNGDVVVLKPAAVPAR